MVSSRGCSVISTVQHSRSCHVIQSTVSCRLFLLSWSPSPGPRVDRHVCRHTVHKIKSFLRLSALECWNVGGSDVDTEGFCCITATKSPLTLTLSIIQEDRGLATVWQGRMGTMVIRHPLDILKMRKESFSLLCNVLKSPSRVYLWVFPEFLVAVVKGKPSPLLLYVPRWLSAPCLTASVQLFCHVCLF